ncbi:MAG: class D beta-lactamase [Candidatus Cyclobacteriaceae bacterium M3_2C_046]
MRKLILLFHFYILCFQLTGLGQTINPADSAQEIQVIKPALQDIIDAAGVSGSVLIYHYDRNIYYSNNFEWTQKGHLPASTFKIANSIIALETGIVEDQSTLFPWDGKKRPMAVWERNMTFKEAFQLSCVPCYQQVALSIGADRMRQYLSLLNYGKMEVNDSNIDLFWLEGQSSINQVEQINFLVRLYESALPVSERTMKIIKRIMVIEENDKYILRGKTGWSIRNGNNNGWFVGYLEQNDQVYFFATNIIPGEAFNLNMFGLIRKTITEKGLKVLGVL